MMGQFHLDGLEGGVFEGARSIDPTCVLANEYLTEVVGDTTTTITNTSVDEKEVTEGVDETESVGSNTDSAAAMVFSIAITHMLGVVVAFLGLLMVF